MMTALLRMLGLDGLMLEVARLAIVAALCGGAYLWLADHHYDRGYNARSAEVAAATAAVNAEVVSVGEADARARAAAEEARQDATREAWEAFRRFEVERPLPATPPAPGCPEPPRAAVCRGLPPSAIDKLNRIK